MQRPRKRLSAGMGLSADGVDPAFEFDVPRVFTDLSRPPAFASKSHDAWFDLVHPDHSRAADERTDEPATSGLTATAAQRTLLQHHHKQHHEHASEDADGEKENAGGSGGAAMRSRRRNVASSAYGAKATASDATPVGTLKATMRTVSASTAKTAGSATRPTTKLPFGNSTGPSTSAQTAANTSARKQRGADASSGANSLPRKRTITERPTEASKARSRAAAGTATAAGSHRKTPAATTAGAGKDLQDLQALLAKHNKKFKATHTYEPRQHSVRDVRQWEQRTQKSYYKLTLEDRFQANAEIAQLVREREDAAAA